MADGLSRLSVYLADDEEPSPIAVGIAVTLLGSISFQMGLLYLTNHSDRDMRKYSYGVINQTVSIFCAVLMFQAFDDIVQQFIDGMSMELQALVDMLHMLVWFTILQLVLAWIAGVSLSAADSDEKLAREKSGDAKPAKELQLQRETDKGLDEKSRKDLKCYSVLMAHLTGFASINAWGAVQQLPLFRSPVMSFMVLPLSILGQFVLQRATDFVREKVAGSDGEKDERERSWDEECEEAENDVMGLTLSFNLVQAVRFAISGSLPGQDGKDPPEVLHSHTVLQAFWLFLSGCSCIALMVVFYLHMMKEGAKGEEAEEDESCVTDTPPDTPHESEAEDEEDPVLFDAGVRVQAQRERFWYSGAVNRVQDGHYFLDWDVSWDDPNDALLRLPRRQVREFRVPGHDAEVQLRVRDEWKNATVKSIISDGLEIKVQTADGEKYKASWAEIRLPVSAGGSKSEDEEEEESVVDRLSKAITIAFAMAFAWSLFYAAQMALATIPRLHDAMVLSVVLTLCISGASFLCIRLLDIIDDFCKGTANLFAAKMAGGMGYLAVDVHNQRVIHTHHSTSLRKAKLVKVEKKGKGLSLMTGNYYVYSDGRISDKFDKKHAVLSQLKPDSTGRLRFVIDGTEYDLKALEGENTKNVDLVLKKIIRALGILVGFGWEQCFDEAVENLSEVMPSPHLSRFFLALFCIIIIVPAWKWYMLPMSENAGWKFGFVVDHTDDKMSDLVLHLAKKKGGMRPHAEMAASHLTEAWSNAAKLQGDKPVDDSMALRRGSNGKDQHVALPSPVRQEEATSRTPLLTQAHSFEQGSPVSNFSSYVAVSPQGSVAVPAELRTLRDTNIQLRTAADGFLDLYVRLRETSGEDRRALLRSYNHQMDNMLTRMKDLQASVARGRSPSRSPSPSPASRLFRPAGAPSPS